MKRKNLLLIVLALMVNSAIAAPALKVEKGNWVALLKEEAVAYVVFDYSKATWEGKKSYEEFCGDTYISRTESSVVDFVDAFNMGRTNLEMSNDSTLNAKYKLTFHINKLERKQGMSMWGRFFIRVYGHMEIVNLESNEIVCAIAINGHAGGDDFVPEHRLSKCFKSLGWKLLDI
ncbi:MAG: hypothetical protein ACOX0S_00360 [Paludibacteraceae bacterium]|jgi:hypothetical protein